MSLTQYSDTNISNSIAVLLASKLITSGYLVYWHDTDQVQTPDGMYYQYSVNQAAYLADPDFLEEVTNAKGLLTVTGDEAANPRFITRLSKDGTVEGQDSIHVPALSIGVGPMVPMGAYELGSTLKWRVRRLEIEVAARDEREQEAIAAMLGEWFDDDVSIEIVDHAAGDLSPVGKVLVTRPSTQTEIIPIGAEAVTYQILFNARMEYVA